MKKTNLTCWIIVNGYLQQQKFSDLALFLKEAAERNGVSTQLIRNTELMPVIENGQALIKGRYTDVLPDFVLFMDKDIHLAKHLELMGLPVYNRSHAIAVCDSKALTHQALANHGIPMPKTIFPPFTYEGVNRIDFQSFKAIGLEIGYPLVLKEAYGSFGQQVYLIESEQQLIEKVKELAHKPFVIQEFIKHSLGRDLRLNVVGDQVVAAMLRRSDTDFRANITTGGKMEPYVPTDAEVSLAIKSARLLGTDFAGVDLLFGEEGPLLCEVNSNSHLLNIFDCTGINVADYMIAYIVGRLGWKQL